MQRITDRDTFRSLAEGAGPATRIPVECRVSDVDPFAAYRRARTDEWGVCLETTGEQSGWGYFAVEPSLRCTVTSGGVRCGPDGACAEASHGDYADGSPTLAALDGLVAEAELRRGPCDVPYPGGVFGWVSYDVARELESLPGEARDDRGLPRLQAARYDTVAAWHSDDPRTLRICAAPRLDAAGSFDPADPAAVDAAYDHAVGLAESLAERATTGDPSVAEPSVATDRVGFTSETSRADYADRVRAVRQYVRAGDTFQANVSQRLHAPAAVHPVETYAALREVNPAPYSGLVEFRAADLVSASPELLVRREPDADEDTNESGSGTTPRLETEPIAGTRPRGETAAADDRLEAELTSDEKERAEHAMLVDLERNDLGKVSQPGSVEVAEYRRVDRYSSVMHLVSRVTGRERADRSLADTLAAVFPGGTITGAPKPRTMAIIDELEATRRGPYTGSLFAAGFDGRLVANILIRTLVGTDDEYHLRVGAGIVHDSVPEREYEETLDKARGLVSALDAATDGARLAVERPARADGTGAPPTEPGQRGNDPTGQATGDTTGQETNDATSQATNDAAESDELRASDDATDSDGGAS